MVKEGKKGAAVSPKEAAAIAGAGRSPTPSVERSCDNRTMHTPQNFSSRVGPAAGAGRVSAGLVLLLSLAAVVVAAGLIVARLVPDDATLPQRLAPRLQ